MRARGLTEAVVAEAKALLAKLAHIAEPVDVPTEEEDEEALALVSTHALAELYGVLTRIPGGLSPEEAQLTVGNLPNRMRAVPLTTGAYMTAVERCAAELSRASGAPACSAALP